MNRRATPTMNHFWGTLVFLFMLATIVYLAMTKPRIITTNFYAEQHREKFIVTQLGNVSYSRIEREVYNPMGYSIVTYAEPFAALKQNDPQACPKVFLSWFLIASTHDTNNVPLRTLPYELVPNYTLNSHAYLNSWYFDERPVKSPDLQWTKAMIDEWVRTNEIKCADYPGEGEAMYYATKFHSVAGLTGLVVGSITPWVEVFCLKNGAKKLVTLEYKKIISDDPRLEYRHPIDLAKNWTSFDGAFDFAASFSSIEHSGLGRYGDAFDSIGDIREVRKVWCLLKTGGLFFLGLPAGVDGLTFNAHRIYGRIRLPLLFEGYELLDIFYGRKSAPHKLDIQYFDRNDRAQHVFVLRKKG